MSQDLVNRLILKIEHLNSKLVNPKIIKMSEETITMDTQELGEKIVKVLKTIYDPEIPVDIYELGLIYDVLVNEANEVKILMTLTSPNCPDAEVEITFDPPWTQDLMSEEAKLELGLL